MGLVWTLSGVAIFLIAVVVAKEYRLANPRDALRARRPCRHCPDRAGDKPESSPRGVSPSLFEAAALP